MSHGCYSTARGDRGDRSGGGFSGKIARESQEKHCDFNAASQHVLCFCMSVFINSIVIILLFEGTVCKIMPSSGQILDCSII